MALDISQMAERMFATALPILSKGGTDIADYDQTELKKITQEIATIGVQYASGDLTEDGMKALLQMQLNSMTILFETNVGLGKVVVENAINAALGVVNTALGVVLKP